MCNILQKCLQQNFIAQNTVYLEYISINWAISVSILWLVFFSTNIKNNNLLHYQKFSTSFRVNNDEHDNVEGDAHIIINCIIWMVHIIQFKEYFLSFENLENFYMSDWKIKKKFVKLFQNFIKPKFWEFSNRAINVYKLNHRKFLWCASCYYWLWCLFMILWNIQNLEKSICNAVGNHVGV